MRERVRERGVLGSERCRERTNRGRVEKSRQREPRADRPLDRREEADSADRVPAEVEEVVVDVCGRDPENVAPDGEQSAFERVDDGWTFAALGERLRLRRGQRVTVDLAVRIHGQRVERDHRRGNEVRGQRLTQLLTQIVAREQRTAGANDVGDHIGIAVLATIHERVGLLHALELSQRGFDVAELDAKAAHLDLMVLAPDELDRAVEATPHHVARSIEPRAGVQGEGVGHEPRRGHLGVVEVTEREPVTTDDELAIHEWWYRSSAFIHDVHRGVGDRSADGHRGRVFGQSFDWLPRRERRRFGRAVHVYEPRRATVGQHVAHDVRVGCFAAEEQVAH